MSLITREIASLQEMPLYLVPFDKDQVYAFEDMDGTITFVKVIARSFNQVSLIKCSRDTGEILKDVKPIVLPISQFIEKLLFNQSDQVFKNFILDDIGTAADVQIDKTENNRVLVKVLNNYGDTIADLVPIMMDIADVRERLLKVAYNSVR